MRNYLGGVASCIYLLYLLCVIILFMAYRRTELAVGEWFHCYSRTIDKSRPFDTEEHIKRFLDTLFLANQSAPMPNMPYLYQKFSHAEIFSLERKGPLTMIGAYCIMPTHYHLLVQPLVENGLSEFMHKMGTGFTRYYNDRLKRVGNLFVKPFRSKHVANEGYLGRVASYIHLNPIELFEPNWKQGRVQKIEAVQRRLLQHPYSSLLDYEKGNRPQRSILNEDAMLMIKERLSPLQESIYDAAEYYQFLEFDV